MSLIGTFFQLKTLKEEKTLRPKLSESQHRVQQRSTDRSVTLVWSDRKSGLKIVCPSKWFLNLKIISLLQWGFEYQTSNHLNYKLSLLWYSNGRKLCDWSLLLPFNRSADRLKGNRSSTIHVNSCFYVNTAFVCLLAYTLPLINWRNGLNFRSIFLAYWTSLGLSGGCKQSRHLI